MNIRTRSAVRTGLVAAMLIGAFELAEARPPAGTNMSGSLHAWFNAQHSVTGTWCCDVSDGHILSDSEWRQTADHYEVKINAAWVPVPASALRDPKGGPNPTGSAIVWYTHGSWGLHIYCFAPGWEF